MQEPSGRSYNEYLVPTKSRASPHTRERDPRRDGLGCNRNYKRTLQVNPEKEPQFNPTHDHLFHQPEHTAEAVPDKGTY